MLRAARDAGVRRVVVTSSFAAIGYGACPRHLCACALHMQCGIQNQRRADGQAIGFSASWSRSCRVTAADNIAANHCWRVISGMSWARRCRTGLCDDDAGQRAAAQCWSLRSCFRVYTVMRAYAGPEHADGAPFDENDWTDPAHETVTPYVKSKVLAATPITAAYCRSRCSLNNMEALLSIILSDAPAQA